MILHGSRNELAELFTGIGVEVGTEQGAFAAIIATYAVKLWCVDLWKPYKGYRDHTGKEKLEMFYDITKEHLKGYDNVELIRKSSMEAVKEFADGTLDFVYIDANHSYKYVMEDITEWTKKVRVGGIVAGDDYSHIKGRPGQFEVIAAVDDYVKEHGKDLIIWPEAEPRQWMFYV